MTRAVSVAVGVCIVAVALALAVGAVLFVVRKAEEPPPTLDASVVQVAPEPRDTASDARARPEAELTPEQRRELERIATLGYVSGTVAPSEESGVLRHERGRTWDGYTLCTYALGSTAVLMDMDGTVVHEWDHPGAEYWARARLLEGGDLLVVTSRPYRLMRIDSGSRLVWLYNKTAHHDLDILPDGNIVAIVREAVRFPHINDGVYVLEDHLVTLTLDGEEVARVPLVAAFENSERYSDWFETHPFPEGVDIFHTNSIEIVESDGSVQALISIRAIDTIALVDLESGLVTWAVSGDWRMQHEAMFVDGNLLFFDNLGAGERSRVRELDVETLEVVWEYTDDDFYTRSAGAQQRLPNGNTLITESDRGRIIEVSEDGDVLWEYVNPKTTWRGQEKVVLGIMRAERIPYDFPMDWLE
jgi:hypothetical protein